MTRLKKQITASQSKQGSSVGYGENVFVAIRDTLTVPPGDDWQPAIKPTDDKINEDSNEQS
jgi:hypothetical protein